MEIREGYQPCHQWHLDSEVGTTDSMLLKYIDGAVDRSLLFVRLDADLTECWDCIEVYHEARERLVNKHSQTGYYDRILLNLEEKRVKQSLSTGTDDEVVLFLVIHEVSEHPFLLFNQEIASAFCSKLMELNNSIGVEAFLPQHVPSMYLLVIHPIKEVRELAWRCIQQSKHHITSDLYDDISPVLSRVLNLHIAGCLDQPMMQVSYNQSPSKDVVLPPHLVCTQSRHSYWQGVTRLFKILSEDALKHRFINCQSHKQYVSVLIDTISTHDEDSGTDSPFWWQLQCLTYLMDKLGSSVWQDISKSKMEGFFEIITRHPVFLPALEALRNNDHNSTSMRRDSSIVTQSSLLVDPSEPIQWIVPYIRSLVDFGDSVSDNFCVVITFLCSKLSEQQGYSDTDAGVEVRRQELPDSLIEKLMLALVRVLQCLQKNSLLGALVGKTQQWLKVLLTFLKQHPPVCSKSDKSRLVALSNESRQLLMDVFRCSRKHYRATIGLSVKYIKMVNLPLRLSTAKPSTSAAQNRDLKKLWEVNLKGKEFNDCVKFVEKSLHVLPLTSRSRPQTLEERNQRHQLQNASKRPLMRTSATTVDENIQRPKPLSSNTNGSGSSSSSPSEDSESLFSPIAPSRHPSRNLADEFSIDLKPSRDELIRVKRSQELELSPEESSIIQISSDSELESDLKARLFEEEDQTLPNSSTSKADKGCSAKCKPLIISSSDDVALISDIIETGEDSSSLEDIFGVQSSQLESQNEERQITLERGSPCVVLERFPELEELDCSIKQVRVTSINPLVINKLPPNSRTTRPEWSTSSNKETTEDMASSDSDLCKSFNRNVFLHVNKQEKMRKEVQEEEVTMPSCSYQPTLSPLTPLSPFMSSSSSSLSGTKSRQSKYPKNRLSLKKRNQGRHFATSSSDEDEVKTQIFNSDNQERKLSGKMKDDAKKEKWYDQDQEFVLTDDAETQFFNPDIQYTKHPRKIMEDARTETSDDQDQEFVPTDEAETQFFNPDIQETKQPRKIMEDAKTETGDDQDQEFVPTDEAETQFFNPDIQETKQPRKIMEDAKTETSDDQDQEFVPTDEAETQFFNPDIQETKQPRKIMEDAKTETSDDQDQEFVPTDEAETQFFNPDIQETKQPRKIMEDAKTETSDDQDQEFVPTDEAETQFFNPDIQETKQPRKIMKDAKNETFNKQGQEFVTRDVDEEEEEEMELSYVSLSCHKDSSEDRRVQMINSNKITEVAQEGSTRDEEMQGGQEVRSLISDDNDDEAMQDLTDSNSDDSEHSQSLLSQFDPPKDVSSPGDNTCSTDSFINKDKPTTSQDESNNRVSPDNQIEEFMPDEDIKPVFVNLKRKSAFSSSYDNSSILRFTEDHQEEDETIDSESYNCSQLFDEDRFSQLGPCIEISSDSDIDLDATEPELNIDLEAVKKEREVSDQDEPETERRISPESQPESSLDVALRNDNDADIHVMWYQNDDISNDGDDERAEDDVDDEGKEDDEDDVNDDQDSVDDVFLIENDFGEVQTKSAESEKEFALTETNENPIAKVFYRKKLTAKRHFSDHEDKSDDFFSEQQTAARRLGQEKEKDVLTWKSLEANKQRKKRKMTQDGQRHDQGASKLATTQKGTIGVIQSGLDVQSTSRQPVAAPRVQGSWKISRQQPLESTPTDAEPLKTIGSSEQPIVTDTFVLDDSQTYRRHKPTNQQDDKPRAAMQTVASRFKSRADFLTQEINKDKTSQRDGKAKARHSSGGQDVGASKARHDSLRKEDGLSRIRHASSPSGIRQINSSLPLPPSNSGVIDQLPTYAQSVYNSKSSIPADVVSSAGKLLPNIPGASEPSCSDVRLTNPEHVEPVGITSQHQKLSSLPSPSGESISAVSRPVFQFFTSDLQTTRTAATLSSNAANQINKNNTTPQALHQTQNPTCEKVVPDNQPQTSRQPDQRSKPHNEEIAAGGPLPLQAIEVNAKHGKEFRRHPNTSQPLQQSKPYNEGMVARQAPPLRVLQRKEAVNLPKTSGLTEEDFYCWVIGWDSQWLDIVGLDAGNDLRQYPPILAECPYKSVKSVPLSFDSVQEYYSVFIPLLLHEVWAEIQNKVNSSQGFQASLVEVNRRELRQTGRLLTCTYRMTIPEGMRPMSSHDLLRISPNFNEAFCLKPVLAAVTEVVQTSPKSPSKVFDSSRQAVGQSWDISVLILAKNDDLCRAYISTVSHRVSLEVITSLLPALCQFKALTSLPNLGMIALDILRFRRIDVFCPGPAPPVPTLELQKLLNKSQVNAASIAIQAINLSDLLPRICMIQGPPGTGKTNTVIELVMTLLKSRREHSSHHSHTGNHQQESRPPKAPPVLLCAPSDTAIDVLVRHLKCLITKRDMPCHIVRVGRSQDIHPTIRCVGLENIVKQQKDKETSDNLFKQTRKKEHAELLKNQISELEKDCGLLQMRGENSEFCRAKNTQTQLNKQLRIFQSEIKDLQRRRAELDRKPSRHYEVAMDNADIVCCTVNGCGSKVLLRSSKTNSKVKMMKFSCVILDEANQCSELDSISTLKNCSMKVVLVGDTQSQPATVTSKIARQCGLQRSLFERLCRLFDGTSSPVHYLPIQLRMHPAISQFPSKHFHRGRMVNDKKRSQRKEAFFLHPYLLFNVTGGQEGQTPSRIFTNEEEVDMVQAVYKMICREKARNNTMLKEFMSVGVTTPYKEQAHLLQSCIMNTEKDIKKESVPHKEQTQLLHSCIIHNEKEIARESFPSEFVLPGVEVSSLDLFQGREKDVIILSCVRANGSSDQSAVGLVGDKNVLNVALTRARYSLFIVGHLPTLQKNNDWAALAADARQRQLIIDVPLKMYESAAKRCSKNVRTNTGTNKENTTQTAPSVTLQSQTSQNVAPSSVCTVMKGSYNPHKANPSCSPKMQYDSRQAAVAGTSTSGDKGSTSGATGVNTIGESPGHRNPKPLTMKSNIASPNAKRSPFKKKGVRFQQSNSQTMNEKSLQWSLTPKPMQKSNVKQSPTKHNPYNFAFQKLASQRTATYNNLGWKNSSNKHKGNQHRKSVDPVPHEFRQQTKVQPAVTQAPSLGNTPNQGKTQHPSVDNSKRIADQFVMEAAGTHDVQNQKSTTSKSARNEQPNQKSVTGDSNGSRHTHLPGSPGMKKSTTNNLTGPSGINNVSTHRERSASTSSPTKRPASSNNRLTVPYQRSAISSSEVHQPSTSGSVQHGAALRLQQTVEKIARNHANTKTTRPLPGLQQDPKQVRRQRKHDARTTEPSRFDPFD